MIDQKNISKLEYIKSLTSKRLENFSANTPAMQQYYDAKKDHPDAVVLFRMGDFYEMFFDDAILCSKELEITLTSRGKNQNSVPLAGIPFHALDGYLAKLVEKGYKVAICEQLEDPKFAKGVVKRGVTKIITPGTKPCDLVNSSVNNYLMSIFQQGNYFSICTVDLTTNECFATILNYNNLINEITKYKPSEIIMPESLKLNEDLINDLKKLNIFLNIVDNNYFSFNESLKLKDLNKIDVDFPLTLTEKILNYSINSIEKYSKSLGIRQDFSKNVDIYSINNFMMIDRVTLRNLELLYNTYDGTSNYSLLSCLNKTKTSMGLRLLKRIILRPLFNKKEIEDRLNAVEELKNNLISREQIKIYLKNISDIERLAIKLSNKSIIPKELTALKKSLFEVRGIKQELDKFSSKLIKKINDFNNYDKIFDKIDSTIDDSYNYTLNDRGYIKSGNNKKLDELKSIMNNHKDLIIQIETKEKEKSKIQNLRITYNKVIGYHITISKTHLKNIPEYFIKKQSLVNGERFVTPELKELEEKILSAEQNIDSLELKLYNELLEELQKYIEDILNISKNIAYLDVLLSFADIAHKYNYSKPEFNDNNVLHLKNSRHPVVELIEPNFTPNDLYMDSNEFIHIITGPNLSGKSTFMRQVSLIQIMAQIGSFVPSEYASIHLVDRVFTRIGASDFLVRGESTFMVEMLETANILNNATEKSLIILDEIGRGTSTFDGIAIAYSVVDYIANKLKAKTLFATHYHQLNKMTEKYPYIKNYNVLVKETGEGILFLHKIISGGTNKSYGIHVAKLAGVPQEVINNSLSIISKFDLKDNIADKIFEDLGNNCAIVRDTDNNEKENTSKNIKLKKDIKDLKSLLDYDLK